MRDFEENTKIAARLGSCQAAALSLTNKRTSDKWLMTNDYSLSRRLVVCSETLGGSMSSDVVVAESLGDCPDGSSAAGRASGQLNDLCWRCCSFNCRYCIIPAPNIQKAGIDILPPPNADALWRGIPTLSAVAHFS
jgi:hypothetical protein